VRISAASLRVLAGWADTFASGAPAGQWRGGDRDAAGVITMPWYEYGGEMARFMNEMSEAKFVRSIDWMAWAETSEGQRLMRQPAAIAHATPDDLIYLLTTIIRGERFSDGEITGAYERGTLLALAERARVLLGEGTTRPSSSGA
jgi:hypothetical protein